MANLKGFIKDSSGNIVLPISRGELIFDAAGNIALHSEVFKAEAAERDAVTKVLKTGTGKYGLMTPEDLLDLHEALARISAIEVETGVTGDSDQSLKQMLLDLIDKVGYKQGEVTGKDALGNDIITNTDTGIYKYINDQIVGHLAQSDALKYKGTLGTSGTVSALPTTGIDNGDTYKVITAGTYAGQAAKPGDLFIALYTPGTGGTPGTYSWDFVPSGNEQETFIKVLKTINGADSEKTLSGTVTIKGSDGILVGYDGNTIQISGNAGEVSGELGSLGDRVTQLENTVDGTSTAPGLTDRTGTLEDKVTDAVTTWDQIRETTKGEDGQTDVLANGDDLVKASAVYDIAIQLGSYMLTAETMALGTALTATQKGYLAGTIVN